MAPPPTSSMTSGSRYHRRHQRAFNSSRTGRVTTKRLHNPPMLFPPNHPATRRDLLFFTRLADLDSHQATSFGSLPPVPTWQRRGLPHHKLPKRLRITKGGSPPADAHRAPRLWTGHSTRPRSNEVRQCRFKTDAALYTHTSTSVGSPMQASPSSGLQSMPHGPLAMS